jgi:signal transduction histidine kinase
MFAPTAEHGAGEDPLKLRARGALCRWLRVNEEPLAVPDALGVFEYLPSEEQQVLFGLGVRLCLPLSVDGRLLGIVLLAGGSKTSGLPEEFIGILGSCARHIALALDRVARLERDREQLESLARAQQLAVAGQLAASMAHEIRNPLTAIRSGVQVVADSTSATPGDQALLRSVISEVDRINRTLSGVLGLAKPQPLQLVEHDLGGLIQDAAEAVTAYCQHHGIALEAHLTSGLSARVDAGEFRQVLLNTLLNACQAMPRGGTVAIRLRRAGEDRSGGGLAEVTVVDTGVGMPPDQARRAFEPFFTTKRNGSGLGLPICREIMSRHRGTITLDSQVGQGSTVTLTLPLAEMDDHGSRPAH